MGQEQPEEFLQEWKNRIGKDIFLQSEDGTVLASTCSLKELFFREAAGGMLSESVIVRKAAELGLDFARGRVLFLIDSDGLTAGLLKEVGEAVFGNTMEEDSCVGDGAGHYLLIAEGKPGKIAGEVEALQGSLEVEAVSRVLIGVSKRFMTPSALPSARKEAWLALESLKRFPDTRKTAFYARLGLKLAAMELTEEEAKAYMGSFPGKPEQLFSDPDLVHTGEVFLETGLNSAETARRLVVHRNTLNYRLEKIQRISGLDLKQFPDAAAFYYALLVWQWSRK